MLPTCIACLGYHILDQKNQKLQLTSTRHSNLTNYITTAIQPMLHKFVTSEATTGVRLELAPALEQPKYSKENPIPRRYQWLGISLLSFPVKPSSFFKRKLQRALSINQERKASLNDHQHISFKLNGNDRFSYKHQQTGLSIIHTCKHVQISIKIFFFAD